MSDVTQTIVDDLDSLMSVLPQRIQDRIDDLGQRDKLLEVILDLGRVPTARFLDEEIVLSEDEVSNEDIEWVVEHIGEFDADNRAGIARTLHRISGIRNRKGRVVGLTCRVGRAVFGTIEILKDLIESGKSVLLLGRPGVGKTTMLREAARVLADHKRVVIVDTSNEIGGDGDIPHPAVGRARRMQVAMPSLQHEVMIEAVENHNPQVIVIDEIGREMEALAARTIAERGVQLIATAHGNALENLLLNPTLSDLVGGIESVTLSDEEARRRGTQKTVLERRAPPTFDILVEIQDRQRVLVRADVTEAVDGFLRGYPGPEELRYRDDGGEMHIDMLRPEKTNGTPEQEQQHNRGNSKQPPQVLQTLERNGLVSENRRTLKEKHIFPFGIARNRLLAASQTMRVPVTIVDRLKEADIFVTTKQYYRKRPRVVVDAERRGVPLYVLRANTSAQIETFLKDAFELTADDVDPFNRAIGEAEDAIKRIASGNEQAVTMMPQSSFVRKYQHNMAQEANLRSKSIGKEPYRSVRIYREN